MAFTRTYDGEEPVRVNKWLGQTGVCSRREADTLIANGLVSIDGETISDAGRKIQPGETLTLNDTAQAALASGMTLVLHKPVGYVSGQPDPGKIPAVRLLTKPNRIGEGEIPARDASLPPIGRLDEDSRGLLLLSSDGVVAKAVIGPASELDKEYLVVVEGLITEGKLSRLRHGMELNHKPLKPARVTQIGPQRMRFILDEGKYRQIRRMCELVGLEVVDLYRTRIGPLELGDLPEGRWRHLTNEERAMLIAHSAS
ncbi:pseudouridine synthase [Brevundimonas sp. TWP1-2-1b1]|uniref:pseudouridine synthase n=1 Tax=unclassified Brevundimonas TaxID=2622653 RepID=UPI003CF72528